MLDSYLVGRVVRIVCVTGVTQCSGTHQLRIGFEMLFMTLKALHSQAPMSVKDLLMATLVYPMGAILLTGLLVVSRARLVTKGYCPVIEHGNNRVFEAHSVCFCVLFVQNSSSNKYKKT